MGAALASNGRGSPQRSRCAQLPLTLLLLAGVGPVGTTSLPADEPNIAGTNRTSTDPTVPVLKLLKTRCGKCHGAVRPKAELELLTLGGIARGGESGEVIVGGKPEESLLWQRILEDEMPPDDPLPEAEREVIRCWIGAGAPGLADAPREKQPHWAFRHLSRPAPPAVRAVALIRTPVDRFILARLEAQGLSLNRATDRRRLIRRVSFDLTGLPPAPEEIDQFLNDPRPGAYARMVDRYLASPAYGECWGGHWLDTAGYADSNGYFQADTDRPLAYRYRDYVVRAINSDKPFDQFIREQLAGDELAELAGYQPGEEASPRIIAMLEATHFLRNAMDGTDNSDGNEDERRTDKYKAIEGTIRILGSALFGLTLQCSRCHEHKFEPIEHREYYQLQAILAPAFPIDHWVTPKQRFVYAARPGETAVWKEEMARLDSQQKQLEQAWATWRRAHPEPSRLLFRDTFDQPPRAARRIAAREGAATEAGWAGAMLSGWSNTVPGDAQPAGQPPIHVGSAEAPGAIVNQGALQIIESGAAGDRVLSTTQRFDWTPDRKGDWIQVMFDLVADRVGSSKPAIRIAYLLALTDFNDRRETCGGNVLLDGNPQGGAAVHVDYPGADSRSVGQIGAAGYRPGHNFGVCVTNVGDGRFRLEHLYDGVPEEKTVTLTAADLPDGAFGFEYCCGRSFAVDNVVIERNDPSASAEARKAWQEASKRGRKSSTRSSKRSSPAAVRDREKLRGWPTFRPNRRRSIAWCGGSTRTRASRCRRLLWRYSANRPTRTTWLRQPPG